jgi:hypothetical protein
MNELEAMKAQLKAMPRKKKVDSDRLSSGVWMFNLACSGDPDWCISKKDYMLMVGDSQSLKTWIALQLLAEAAINPSFSKHKLIHNNPERGARMSIRKFFGGLADRLQEPKGGSSKTIQEFYDHIIDLADEGKPFIEVLDSEDALSDENEDRKTRSNKKARMQEDGKVKGSYGGAGKAKENSQRLRSSYNALEGPGSILVMIKQTRDNIGFGSQFNPKTRNGGRSLTFFAVVECWFSVAWKIKKSAMGKKRVVGSVVRVHVKKTRLFGRDRTVDIRFYPNHGIDNTGTSIHWLVEEKHWPSSKGEEGSKDDNLKIKAPEFKWEGSIDGLARKIEKEGREDELKVIVKGVWDEIEEACSIDRKNRYGE